MPFKTPNKTCDYLRSVLPKEQDVNLIELENFAQNNYIPILLPETSAFLKQLLMLKQPKKILEIGTAIGYSGYIMLKTLEFSHLTTIEIEEERINMAKNLFSKCGFMPRTTFFLGDAGEIVPLLDGEFDFIFVDGPKTRYIEYLPYLKKRLKSGGILLCDNVLFNGMLAGDEEIGHKKSSIVRKLDIFLKELMADTDFISSILPVGDGLSLSIKK